MTTVEDKLFLAELVDNMRDAMVASGAAIAELDELRADVERAARDPERLPSGPDPPGLGAAAGLTRCRTRTSSASGGRSTPSINATSRR